MLTEPRSRLVWLSPPAKKLLPKDNSMLMKLGGCYATASYRHRSCSDFRLSDRDK